MPFVLEQKVLMRPSSVNCFGSSVGNSSLEDLRNWLLRMTPSCNQRRLLLLLLLRLVRLRASTEPTNTHEKTLNENPRRPTRKARRTRHRRIKHIKQTGGKNPENLQKICCNKKKQIKKIPLYHFPAISGQSWRGRGGNKANRGERRGKMAKFRGCVQMCRCV